ncbi:MAG: hypothetical protein WDM92_15445 [Caulobacteraceae bacterium]
MAAAIDETTAADIARLGARLLEPRASVAAVLGPKGALAAAEQFQKALAA